MNDFYKNYQGAEDLRSPEDKAKDYSQTEFVAESTPVDWITKAVWRQFPVLNQFYTFKCVAFSVAKLALINFWLETKEYMRFSPNFIYNERINKPSGGMIGVNAFDIWKDKGIPLEAVCPSDQMRESDTFTVSDFAKKVAEGFKVGAYITIPVREFERVASTIQQTGKGVMCWFWFSDREWSSAYPEVMDNLEHPHSVGASRHSVVATDFGLINGKKYIKVEDSAHFGGLHTRWISEEFFKARNMFNAYPMNFKYMEKQSDKPRYDGSIISVQKCLQYEGLFPLNVSFVENFGNITQTAVMKFQVKHGLHPTGVRNIGGKTKAKLLELYP